jgi:hypothetical protein
MADPSLPANLREFHCNHCNGKIRIPRDLPPTTGPCPHCGGVITSPALEAPPQSAPLPSFPSGGYPTPVQAPPAASPLPNLAQAPVQQAPVQQASTQQTPAQSSFVQKAPASTERTRERVGSTKPAPAPAPEPKKSLLPIFLLTILLFGFAGAAGFVVYKELKTKEVVSPSFTPPAPTNNSRAENQYIRSGWERDAKAVLAKFLAAKSVSGKLPYIINGEGLKSQMESFYGGSVIDDQDTPVEAFSIYQLSENDRKRGLFLMTFEQPPQFEMKEFFRPLAPLEVQYGVDEADLLLSTLANVTNFATDPIRVSAFFKKTEDGLKLDWEIFAQTKYRLLETMFEVPEAGQSGVFRVVIEEDVAVKGTENKETKTYRISDPSSQRTSARVQVKIDSEIGRTLSEINWIGQKNRPVSRTATVELKWVGTDRPVLELQRLICWEFLNLGGEVKTSAPAPSPAPAPAQ